VSSTSCWGTASCAIETAPPRTGHGRVLERFPEILTRLAGTVDRFTTMLDCVDVAFLPDGFLDELPGHHRSVRPGSVVST